MDGIHTEKIDVFLKGGGFMSDTAELISVGTELLLGSIANTDAQMISQMLSGLGINVYYHTVVGDNPQRARAAVEIAKGRANIIITTGGLGPTCDDLTKQVLAEAFGRPLVFYPECAEQIRRFYETRLHGGPMPESNLAQAWLPEGSEVLVNDWGTAPGCTFEAEGVRVFMLPGVPRECEAMMRYRVVPWLAAGKDGVIVSRTVKIFGMGESAVETLLRQRMLELHNPTLAPYAKSGEVELRLTAKAESREAGQAMLDPLEAEVRETLGDFIYGVDVSSLEERVVGLLTGQGLTIGTAESCTGGLIAKRVTDIPGASAVLKGGVVAYTNEVKRNLLGVPAEILNTVGAVSPETAAAMAQGARRVLGCDLAVSATGLAGPEEDGFGHTGGTVFLALCDGEHTWVKETHRGIDRDRVRTMTAHTALDMLRRYLTGLEII